MAVNIYDRWHKSRPQPNEPKCKEHKLVPTTAHNKGERWQVRWDVWKDGKREQPRRNFKYKLGNDPEIHAEAFVLKLQRELSASDSAPEFAPSSVRSVTDKWKELRTSGDNTRTTVDNRISKHILSDTIADIPVFDLYDNPELVQLWIIRLTEKGLKPSTIRITAGVLSAILEHARLRNYIPANPMRPLNPLIKLPRVPKKTVIPYTAQQLKDIREGLPTRYRMIPKVGSRLGLRIGEIRGLSPDDTGNRVLHIRRQVKYNGRFNCDVFSLPKGDKTRDIPLSPNLQAFLEQLPVSKVTLPWDRPGGRLVTIPVYAATNGVPWVYRTLLSNWERVHETLGIERTPSEDAFHRLRHTFASRVLHAGTDIRSLAVWLGHTNPAFTLRVYCHFIAGDTDVLFRAFEDDD